MERAHYGLQALLYTVALHRYLRWRLPGYDPERNLAGVLYLFLRGMTGPDTPVVTAPCGVFAWRPPGALVEALSDVLDRGSGMTASTPAASCAAPGLLREFNDAGVLAPADVHVARRLAQLAGEADEAVLLAAALAVRGAAARHVCVDLATIRDTATVDVEEPVDLSALPWPEPGRRGCERVARRARRRPAAAAARGLARSTSTATGARSAGSRPTCWR